MPQETPLDRDIALAFAVRLRRRREEKELTQEKAAEAAGVSRNHYQLLESGLSDRAKKSPANPRLSTLLELARALDCTVGDLADDLHAEHRDAAVHGRLKVEMEAGTEHGARGVSTEPKRRAAESR